MSNPFAKLGKPQTLNPRTIKISQYEQYNSVEMQKIRGRLSAMKRSLPWLAGMSAFFVLLSFAGDSYVRTSLFGYDQRGGQYLDLYSRYDEDHLAYNRQFQRMHVLGEGLIGDESQHSKQLITDLGIQLPQRGSPHVRKQAPHEKFY